MTTLNDPSASESRRPLPSRLLHDLRTPLNHVIGYSELLMEQAQAEGRDSFLPDLQRIRSAGQQLLGLLNDNFSSVSTPESSSITERKQAPETLPVPQPPPPLEACLVGVLPSGPLQGSLLVIDDNEANREVLSRQLRRQGYAVATAENGREGLEMLQVDAFDLVLLDMLMPEMDGNEVLRRLKADERLRHLPVIVISALNELEAVANCIEMGAEDYLPKPFNPTLLKARIGASLEKKRARDREVSLFEKLEANYRRLQELEKQRDDLTNMIVHDMRTPLTSVIAGMQSLEVCGELTADQQEMTDMAIAGGTTLLGMINDLLDVEKMESGTLQLDYAALSVADLVTTAAGQVASLAESKGLTLLHEIPSDLPPIQADESKLCRTLVNLLGNAIKFTPSGGTVKIEARQSEPTHDVENRWIEFAVIDSGEGIPSDAFERIFEKFGQVESRAGGRVMSTGLGLTFCKLAVEAHGGRIGVESVPGKGSTFGFRLPLAPIAE